MLLQTFVGLRWRGAVCQRRLQLLLKITHCFLHLYSDDNVPSQQYTGCRYLVSVLFPSTVVPVQGYRCISAWKRHSGWGAPAAAQLSPSTHPSGTSSVRASPKSVLPLRGSQTWSELHSRPPCAPELLFFPLTLSPQSDRMQPGPVKNRMQEGTRQGKQNEKTEYQKHISFKASIGLTGECLKNPDYPSPLLYNQFIW